MWTKNSQIHEYHLWNNFFSLSLLCKIRKKHYPPMLKGSIYRQGKDGRNDTECEYWILRYIYWPWFFEAVEVLIISTTAGDVYLADSAEMLTRRNVNQVRLGCHLGVLASLLVTIVLKLHPEESFSPRATTLKYPSSISKYTTSVASVYLDMDSGYLSGVGQVNIQL